METEPIPIGPSAQKVELVDNWHDRWPTVLGLIDRLDKRPCLNLDEDGWLSARQNLLVAFDAQRRPVGYICFRVEPLIKDGQVVTAEGRPQLQAVVESTGVDANLDHEAVSRRLREAGMHRALELNCRHFRAGPQPCVNA